MALTRRTVTVIRSIYMLLLMSTVYLSVARLDDAVMQGVDDKAGHVLAFYVLALFMDFSFPNTGFRIMKIVPLFLYGVLLEIVQYFLPHRSFEIFDIAADVAGIFLYMSLIPLMKRFSYLKGRWEQEV